MLVRTLGATVVATALVLLPTAAHAAGPVLTASSTVVSAEAPRAVHAAADPAATAIPTDALTVGLVVLVGGAMLLALTGRRPDDDEPTD